MANARFGHTATLLPDGEVLITGGTSNVPRDVLASAELFDPSMGTFSAVGNMTLPRAAHGAILLANRLMLVAGGSAGSMEPIPLPLSLYDPTSFTFAPTTLMNALHITGGGPPRPLYC